MSLADLTSPTAVKKAIAECDSLGRDKFLSHYGYGAAREYVVRYHDKDYDSKAIAGVAHGFEFPELGPLNSEDFSGGVGVGAAARKLSDLGFKIAGLSSPDGWSLEECEITVDAYFGCVALQIDGKPFTKSHIYKEVASQLNSCGCRIGETLQIEWSQVDLDARLIRLEPEQTKTDEARVLPLPSVVVDMLRQIEPKQGRVFDGTNLRKEWMKACAACELGTTTEVEGRPYDPIYSGLTLHDLRRSAVRNLRKAGVSEKEAMKISGHKTRSVFDRYNIVSTDDVMDAMRKVEIAALNDTRKPVQSASQSGSKSKLNSETLGDTRSKTSRKSLMALSSRG